MFDRRLRRVAPRNDSPRFGGRDWRRWAWLVAIFALVEAVMALAGVRFNAALLGSGLRYLDPQLLRHHLWQSLWFLHSQPPLFNLYLGLVLQLGGRHADTLLQASFLAMGWLLFATVARLLEAVGLRGPWPLVLATLFLVNPAFILYQNLLFYAFPLALLVAAAALRLTIALARGRRRNWSWCFCMLLLLAGLWSRFNIVFYALSVAGAVLLLPGPTRRQVLTGAALPGIVLLGLAVKNVAQFGTFMPSSWVGMNLAATTLDMIPAPTRQALVRSGALAPIALVPRFSPPGAYAGVTPPDLPAVPALTEVTKSTGPSNVNYNNAIYLAVSRAYMTQDLRAIRLDPRAVILGVAEAWGVYFWPTARYADFFTANRQAIARWYTLWDRWLYGELRVHLRHLEPSTHGYGAALHGADPVYPPLLCALVLVFADATRRAWRLPHGPERDQAVIAAWIWCVVLYGAAVGNLAERGENNRFRFATDPLWSAMLGGSLQATVLPVLRRWWRLVFPGRRLAPERGVAAAAALSAGE